MGEKSKKLGVALVHTLCPVCTRVIDDSILLNKRLTEGEAKKVEAMNNTNTWSKELCSECQEMKSKGFILIGADEKKTEDVTNPWRTGQIWCVKQEVADELFKPHPPPASGISFIDINVARQMQLPNTD